jgi:hypothetical protein
MGRVELADDGRLRYLIKRPFYRVGGTVAVADEELRELLASLPRLAASPRARSASIATMATEWEEIFEETYLKSSAEVVAYPSKPKTSA